MKFFLAADPYWKDIVEFSMGENDLFEKVESPDESDFVIVAFCNTIEQHKYIKTLDISKLVITKPYFNDELFGMPNVYFLLYQHYDQSLECFKNQAFMVDSVKHIHVSRFGIRDMLNERFHIETLKHRFKAGISYFISPHGEFYDEVSAYSDNEKTCVLQMDGCEYKERWGASIMYTCMILTYGTDSIKDRNRDFAIEIINGKTEEC